ncbi:POK18 protein, partial [Smithornis capensis]|nr:POK18 protein [Smithornis capensis]
VQKLLGSINWVSSYLGLTTKQLAPLFALLKGDRELSSPHNFTVEAKQVLTEVKEAISKHWVCCVDLDVPVTFFVVLHDLHPTGILGQWNDEWEDPLHLE